MTRPYDKNLFPESHTGSDWMNVSSAPGHKAHAYS